MYLQESAAHFVDCGNGARPSTPQHARREIRLPLSLVRIFRKLRKFLVHRFRVLESKGTSRWIYHLSPLLRVMVLLPVGEGSDLEHA